MSRFQKSVGPCVYRRPAWRGLVLLSTAVVLVSACGSGNEGSSLDVSETTVAVAGAQENAVVSGAVCYSWPNGTTDAQPCAVGLKGPGGGRVFYDAGSAQPWGRFLEVAPQAWGGTLVQCLGSCGAATEAPYYVTEESSDEYLDGAGNATGYFPCRKSNRAVLLPGEAGDTLWEIGGGRRNTEVLSKTAECVDGSTSALTLATGYRGGGLSDWYLPSGGELTALCKYTGRDAIGGFLANAYVSSTVGPKSDYTNFFHVWFGSKSLCERFDGTYPTGASKQAFVRPIRAFS